MSIVLDRTAEAVRDPRDLVDSEMFQIMVDDVVTFDKVTRSYAEQGVGQFPSVRRGASGALVLKVTHRRMNLPTDTHPSRAEAQHSRLWPA